MAIPEKLQKIRASTDLKLKPLKHLKSHYDHYGEEREVKLRYYQIQGVLHLAVMPRFVLGDDCGLGKTIVSIAAYCGVLETEPNTKAVIITTKSSVPQWASDGFGKFTKDIKVLICNGTPPQREKTRQAFLDAEGPTVMLMGYRSAVQDFTALQNWKIPLLILDEVAAVKSTNSRVHQCIEWLAKNSTRVWGLTATLIKNDLMEGHGIYKVVVPGLFGSRNKFMNEYSQTRMQRVGKRQIPVVVGYTQAHIKAFKEKIDPYFIGRAKWEVATELPVLETRNLMLDLNPVQEKLYAEALSELELAPDEPGAKLTTLIKCQQIVDHPAILGHDGDSVKLDWLISALTAHGEEHGEFFEEKVIVFSRFATMVEQMEKALQKVGISYTRITGADEDDDREKAKAIFQDPNSGVNVILITTAASEAVNLQAAKAIIFYDCPWSAGDLLQILGRMLRIGSTHDRCYAIHLVTKRKRGKTIHARVLDVLSKKMRLIEAVLGKRIKGEKDMADALLTKDSSLNELFDLVNEDAKTK